MTVLRFGIKLFRPVRACLLHVTTTKSRADFRVLNNFDRCTRDTHAAPGSHMHHKYAVILCVGEFRRTKYVSLATT